MFVHSHEILERVKGIEPSYSAWKAVALPLSYTRIGTKARPSPGRKPLASFIPGFRLSHETASYALASPVPPTSRRPTDQASALH